MAKRVHLVPPAGGAPICGMSGGRLKVSTDQLKVDCQTCLRMVGNKTHAGMPSPLYDVIVTERGPNPLALMKVIRDLSGQNMEASAIESSLRGAKEFVDFLRQSGNTRVLLNRVPERVAIDALREIRLVGGNARYVANSTTREADAYTYLVDVKGEPKKKVQTANSIEQAWERARIQWGSDRVRSVELQRTEVEKTLQQAKAYSAGAKTLARIKAVGEFREYMQKFVEFYIESAEDDEGPDWALQAEGNANMALDFAEFVTALQGEVEEPK